MIYFKRTILRDFAKERYMAIVHAYPRIQEEKTQRYIILTLTFFALSFLGVFAISPTLNTIADLHKQIADSEFVQKSLKTKLDNLSSLNSQYENLQNDFTTIDAAVPATPQVSLLLAQMQSIAKNTGVVVSNLQTYQVELTQTKQAIPKTSSFDFTLTLDGKKENLLQFLKTMTSFDRVVTIDSIHFINEQKERLTIRAKTFFIL